MADKPGIIGQIIFKQVGQLILHQNNMGIVPVVDNPAQMRLFIRIDAAIDEITLHGGES
ncbi:MAG: hypothetical protein ACR5LG_10010 [Sodalis sp. (in: enterobacteria)]